MSETMSRAFHRQLINEIGQWQAEKLVAPELAASLIARYPAPVTKNRLITILSMLGAILIGLGALLFIGSNWEHLSKILKVELIVGAILLSHVLAWQFSFVPGNRPRLGSALLLVGSLFYGAGIWLISQIFNLDIALSNGLMLWSVGAATMALAARSTPLGCLTSILIGAYNLSWNSNTLNPFWPAAHEPLLHFALTFGFSIWLGYFLRSPWSVILSLVGGAIWVGSNASVFGLLAYGIAIFAIHLYHRTWLQPFAPAYLYVGAITSLLALFYMTFSHGDWAVVPTNGYLVGFGSLFVLLAVGAKCRQFSIEVLCIGLVLFAGWMCTALFNNFVEVVFANLALFAAMVGLIFAGLHRLRSAALVNITLVFFVMDIIARYFDTFFKMLDRSVFFVVGGLMLVMMGSYLEQTRRKLLEGMNT